jgi:hypothetical protein
MPDAWSPFIQLGVGGIVLLVLYLIVRTGDLRTKFELESEKSRRERAESMVDTMLPAIERLTEAVEGLARLMPGRRGP